MDKNADARNNQSNARRYLKQAENEFSISPTTGLYQPKTSHPASEIQVHVDANLDNPRPRGTIQDSIANFLSGTALLISALTLIGLGLTVNFAYKQWQEMSRAANSTAEASRVAACALEENRKQFSQTLGEMRKQTSTQANQVASFKKSQIAILRIRHEISTDHTKVKFFVKNIGHSAALSITMRSDAIVTPIRGGSSGPTTESLKTYLKQLPLTQGGLNIGDGEEYPPIEMGLPDASEMRNEISKGITRVVYLNISYQDIFLGETQSTYDCLFLKTWHGGLTIVPCPPLTE
jgi:hypothetical protein